MNMSRTLNATLLLCALMLAGSLAAQTDTISLAGTWQFRLDSQRTGHSENWQTGNLQDLVFLPGSTDQAGFGEKTSGPEKGWLSRPFKYEGAAWYRREVVVPESWRGKRIVLFLERPHWQTETWVDGKTFGSQNSLSTPHVYDLTEALPPGVHQLTLCVDNTYRIEVGRNAHSVTEHTQTNWNGIVGRIELRASPPVWIESAEIYPNIKARTARIEATIRNITGVPVQGEVSAAAPKVGVNTATAALSLQGTSQKVVLELSLREDAAFWDEYEGHVYPIDLALAGKAGLEPVRDRFQAILGLRSIATRGTQFLLNGRPIFLRGTLECNIFPFTGYPPMDVEAWERLFRIARSYGLNHFRFHSWCPPEAAFVAADRSGFLLHVELPVWSSKTGTDRALNDFMRLEGRRILQTYGNHPSFTMLCLGNELTGDYKFMDDLVTELKASDPRRLYTFTADHRRREPGPTSDYYVTHHTKIGAVRIHGERFAKTMNGTDFDFTEHVKITPMPLVAHELGQWVTYPSYAEIASYTGVLKPRNLEAFRERLAMRGMIDQTAEFQRASGRFAWLAYKEDIETAFRTPGFGGFQLLQLQDFPGQGEALIGLLDSFWHSKGILTPAEVREFCNETVALLRFPKFAWTNSETFHANAEIAHYGRDQMEGAVAVWSATDDEGKTLGSGALRKARLTPGTVTPLGEFSLPLSEIRRATKVTLTLSVRGTEIRNHWGIWVYPRPQPGRTRSVLVTNALDEAARKRLDNGGKVLLLWPVSRNTPQLLETQFLPVFWSLSWFPKQPGTMGILCDPQHPALRNFPTEGNSNWQWWDITEPSQAFILDDAPPGFRPIVQVIDDYHRNHRLAAIFETKVGLGNLLVSSLDLQTDLNARPAARQLLESLLDYIESDQFDPKDTLPASLLEQLLATPTPPATR